MRRLLAGLALALTLSACGSAGHGVPRGFRPETAAAVGPRDVWILGQGNELVRSTDAGAHFERLAFPPFPAEGNLPVIEFADARVGYAYDRGSLYVTRDGGASWSAAERHVTQFAVAGGYVYATTPQGLERSPVARDAWTVVRRRAARRDTSIAVRGSHVWLLGPSQRKPDSPTIAISTNSGRTFTTGTGPCSYELPGRLVPAGGNVVWAVCPTGMMASLYVSKDGGKSFAIASFHDPGGTGLPPLSNAAGIFPLSRRVAILYGGAEGPIYRTTDEGRNWAVVRRPGKAFQLDWLEFPTQRLGLALISSRFWRTTDGGASWHAVPVH